jgi:hypothetical protein
MQRRQVVRLIRVSTTVACLSLAAVVMALWLRNFWVADVIWTPLPAASQLTIASADGQIELGISYPSGQRAKLPETTWGWQTYTASQNRAVKVVVPWKTVIRYRRVWGGAVIVLPHWLVFLVPLLVSVVPWIRWSRRFTIRTMLVVTTLVAVVLAMAVTAGE